MRQVNDKIEDMLKDRKLQLLVNAIKKEPDFLSYQLSEEVNSLVIQNNQLYELFLKHRKTLYSIVIFEEFLKEIAACLYVKELAVDMMEAYEDAWQEDVKLECAFAKFQSEVKDDVQSGKGMQKEVISYNG